MTEDYTHTSELINLKTVEQEKSHSVMSQTSIFSSCFEHRLEHHLTICNARVVTDLPHLRLNCNLRVCAEDAPLKVLLSSLPDEVLLTFINKIERIHAGEVPFVLLV